MRSIKLLRPGSRRLLAARAGLALACALASPLGSSGPITAGRSTAEARASATIVEPISINGVLGGLFSVGEVLAPLQGAASPNTGSVLIRLVNTVPAVLGVGGEGGGAGAWPGMSLLLSGRSVDAGGMIAMLNSLVAPWSGGTLQRELVAAVSMSAEALGPEPGQPAREGDERVAIVVAFN